MDIRFKNSYVMTKEVVREFKFKMLHPVPWAIASAVFALLFAGLYVYAHESVHLMCAVLLAALAVMFIVVVLADVNRTWKQMCEQANSKTIEDETTFTDEKAVNSSHGMESRIELDYADIKRVVKTKHLIVLVTRAKLGHMLRRDSFTVGTEPEFLEFIKERRSLGKLK
ncbi:MAG: YcxB family protein [Clostridia bacterium]|nr:YcxB family protein [Clostridia bacterium]